MKKRAPTKLNACGMIDANRIPKQMTPQQRRDSTTKKQQQQ